MSTPPFPPEIGAIIADNLTSQALCSCICVCRVWHQIFIPFVWASVSVLPISPYQRTPTLSAVEAHAHLIRSLTVTSNNCLQFLSAGCRQLQAIHIKEISSWGVPDSKALQDEVQELMLRVVCDNPSLNTICLTACDISTTADFWKACVERLGPLHHVSLNQVALDDHVSLWCWEALARSRKVTVLLSQWGTTNKHSRVSGTVSSGQHLLLGFRPITQTIEIRQLRNVSVQQQWQLIAQCSEATAITWQPCLLEDPSACEESNTLNLRQIIHPGSWPRLQRLDLAKSTLSDESFSILLENVNPLLRLDARVTRFGELATRSLLLRHITALQYLDLSGCEQVGSRSIQQMLTSGVQLKMFKAYRLKVRELETPHSRPWVCTEITYLSLFFDTQSRDRRVANELVFRQLARLTHLETLNLSLLRPLGRWTTVSLRLDMGLDRLASLKDLRYLYIVNLDQKIETEDAEWMARHWNLQNIRGNLHWAENSRGDNYVMQKEHNTLWKIATRTL